MMKTSANGRAAISQREGCILHAYKDSVGVWTIGVGHTGRATPPVVTPDMTITYRQADEMLAGDLATFEAAVNDAIRVPISQNAFDACCSLAFNIGAHGFTGSTVVHKINEGLFAGAANAFLMWSKPPELAARRQAERKQFLTPDFGVASIPQGAGPLPPPPDVHAPEPATPPTGGFWARFWQALVSSYASK